MTKQIKWAALAGCVATALAGSQAQAAIYNFTLSGPTAATWSIDNAKAPDQADASGLSYFGISTGFAGGSGTDIDFFSSSTDPAGGLRLTDFDSGDYAWFSGPVLYARTGTRVSFNTGSFTLTGRDGTPNGTLAIRDVAATPAAVPEPATWAMMIVGFGLVGGVLRSRRHPAVRPAVA